LFEGDEKVSGLPLITRARERRRARAALSEAVCAGDGDKSEGVLEVDQQRPGEYSFEHL
jgi:hypothetical protein